MRKVTQKALSLTLAAAMAFSVSGCGKSEAEQTQTASTAEKAQQAGMRYASILQNQRSD